MTTRDFFITNVVPGDFDHDGKLDLLVMGNVSPGSSAGELVMRIYFGNGIDELGKGQTPLL